MCQVTKDLERQLKVQHEEEMLHELALEQLEELKRVGVVGDLTIQDVVDFACDEGADKLRMASIAAWLRPGGPEIIQHFDHTAMELLIKQIKGEVIG